DYFTVKNDPVTPDPNEKEDDISYCSLCDLECLNNCVGNMNYDTSILLMVFVLPIVCTVSLNYLKQKPIAHSSNIIDCILLQQLMIEGGTANAIFFRCFVAKKGTETKLKRRPHVVFPRWWTLLMS
ncbi:unnamed protein product, partial [Brassica oleracea var. botrytis]